MKVTKHAEPGSASLKTRPKEAKGLYALEADDLPTAHF
jgi:hypothetical protein